MELSAAAWKQIGAADRKAFQRIVEALNGFDARFLTSTDIPEPLLRERIDGALRAKGLRVRWRLDVERRAIVIEGLGDDTPSGAP